MAGPRNSPGQLRIIGGVWRSRRIEFDAETGVRPTPDRVRETLFNWLREDIPGARCLDLYAGSGALGFEALSRGSGKVTLVDEDIRIVQQLQANLDRLECRNGEVVWSDAFSFLEAGAGGPFEVVFLDPPFRDHILGECAARLEQSRLLSPGALIYIESDRRDPPVQLPAHWRVTRQRIAGQVAFRLCRSEPPS